MNRLLIYYFLFAVTAISCRAYGSSKIDSLIEDLQRENLEDTSKAKLYIEMSNQYFDQSNYVSALSYADKAEKIYRDYDDVLKVAEMQYYKGDIFSEADDYENAIINLKMAREVFEVHGDSTGYYKANLRLATINTKLSNYQKAKSLMKNSLRYFKNKDAEILQEIYYQYAIIHGSSQNLDSALLYLEKSKFLLIGSGDDNKAELGGIFNNIGAVYSKKGNFKQSLSSYQKAIEVFESIDNKKGVGVSLSNIAFLYHKFDSLELAETYYYRASEILKSLGDIFYLSTIYNNWSELYEIQGDYKNAYDMQMKYMKLEDSLAGVEVMTRISEMEKQFELSKKNQELEYLEKENRIKRNRQYLLIAVMILIIVIAFLIYRNLKVNVKNTQLKAQILRNEKKLLKEELDYKGKEVEDLALRIIEKNKFLESLKEEVSDIQGVGENKDKIKNVSTHIKDNLYIDQDRKDFELQLDEIHKSFLFKLSKLYPDLTKSEKRLSTLLVMGMSTKDIASILNLSIAGVKTARYRLRKKIDLDSKIDLTTHFKGI